MALLNDADVTAALGGNLSAADAALVGTFRPVAERLVKKFVGYQIEQATFTDEYYPLAGEAVPRDSLVDGWEMVGDRAVAYGRGVSLSRILVLRNLPVVSITSLYENVGAWDTAGGLWPSNTLLAAGSDYQLDLDAANGLGWSGIVYRRSGAWSAMPRSIKATYVAGLAAGPLAADGEYSDFYAAALMTAVKLFNEFKSMQGIAQGNGGVGPVASESLADWSISYATTASANNQGFMRGLPVSAAVLLHDRINMRRYLGPGL